MGMLCYSVDCISYYEGDEKGILSSLYEYSGNQMFLDAMEKKLYFVMEDFHVDWHSLCADEMEIAIKLINNHGVYKLLDARYDEYTFEQMSFLRDWGVDLTLSEDVKSIEEIDDLFFKERLKRDKN